MNEVDRPAATAYRLPNSHPVLRPMAIASLIGLLATVAIVAGAGAGRWAAVAVIALCWLAYLLSQLAFTRAAMETQGAVLRVRRLFGWSEVSGPEVTGLVQVLTPRGPSFRVRTTGRPRGVLVPCALVHRGQSTLFDWVLTFAPRAVLDARSLQTLDLLRQRGLLAEPAGPAAPKATGASGNPQGSPGRRTGGPPRRARSTSSPFTESPRI